MAQSTTEANVRSIASTTLDVELKNVFKFFDSYTAVQGVDLQIQKGELFSILGPSGCGKTTLLRLIAGFEEPSAGEIYIQGQPMTYVPAYRRPVNTVFQSYALFGHMTIWDNVAFGLKVRGLPKAEIQERVRQSLALVRLEEKGHNYPRQLSGGQQQRVALARALINRPTVVLLDEPLGALDLKLRKQMQVELSSLQCDLGITFIMVTHDQEEALSISSRIAVMNQGRIEQIGSPSEMYNSPKTVFVADFIGNTNKFDGEVIAQDGTNLEIITSDGLKLIAAKPPDWMDCRETTVCVRPEKIQMSIEPPDSAYNYYKGTLINMLYLGDHSQYIVDLETGDNMPTKQLTLMRSQHQGADVMAFDSQSQKWSILSANAQRSGLEFGCQVYVSWSPHDCLVLTS